MNIGAKIAKRRKEIGMTQELLAEKLLCSVQNCFEAAVGAGAGFYLFCRILRELIGRRRQFFLLLSFRSRGRSGRSCRRGGCRRGNRRSGHGRSRDSG